MPNLLQEASLCSEPGFPPSQAAQVSLGHFCALKNEPTLSFCPFPFGSVPELAPPAPTLFFCSSETSSDVCRVQELELVIPGLRAARGPTLPAGCLGTLPLSGDLRLLIVRCPPGSSVGCTQSNFLYPASMSGPSPVADQMWNTILTHT